MAHNNKPDPKFIKKLHEHFDVIPQGEFMPTLKDELMDRFSVEPPTEAKFKPRRAAIAMIAIFAALLIVFFTTPAYEVLGQLFIDLFPKNESNVRPNYGWQTAIAKTSMAELNPTKTPEPNQFNSTATEITFLPTEGDVRPNHAWQTEPTEIPRDPTRTPDPRSMQDAHMRIEEVEKVAGWDVVAPTYLPEGKRFFGANYDPETNIVYLFYQNDILIKQEQITGIDDCDLCTEVGASANPITVQIGGNPGEIVIGVWNLVDDNKYWKNDPWMQRLRWESDNTVFEISYSYLPDSFTYDSFVEMAESME